jgi:hypothetical protein
MITITHIDPTRVYPTVIRHHVPKQSDERVRKVRKRERVSERVRERKRERKRERQREGT